jgi:formiminotetrahydrofolate cyclodeaminase
MNLEDRTFRDFCADLASSAPTPGGGTASAAAAAMGAALVSMVCALTLSKEKYRDSHEALVPVAAEAAEASAQFRQLVDRDARAFEAIVAARKLPKETDDEKGRRSEAIEAAGKLAAEVPMETARRAVNLLSRTAVLAEKGNPNAASDAGVAALLLAAAAEGALLNVGINLGGIRDAEFVGRMEKETALLTPEIQRLRDQTSALVRRSFTS